MIKAILGKLNDRKIVSNNINSETEKTNDLKISSYICRDFLIDFGTEFNYCKFYFSENEIYLFCRNTYPTDIYNSPYILKFKDENVYSYFSKFIVTHFDLNGDSLKIQFKNKKAIGTELTLNIVNISEKDKEILKKNFN
ncbi:hypothetical protein [Flavobacterium bernardetii]|uniref:YokE-like PH domain-containing protein n=1 Tax=Flavobacterium bernardetii TaxID=2813823 RepID=A0ABR7J2D1_9FLAO|nr:hypothetical protein [Flavobacterium bernardetii]MBC5836188.1 hypothetical protein [Flavobacterium bernardetii]